MSSMIGAATANAIRSKNANTLTLGRSVMAEAPNDNVDPHDKADEKADYPARQRSTTQSSDAHADRREQKVGREQKRSGSGHVHAGDTGRAGFLHWVC